MQREVTQNDSTCNVVNNNNSKVINSHYFAWSLVGKKEKFSEPVGGTWCRSENLLDEIRKTTKIVYF